MNTSNDNYSHASGGKVWSPENKSIYQQKTFLTRTELFSITVGWVVFGLVGVILVFMIGTAGIWVASSLNADKTVPQKVSPAYPELISKQCHLKTKDVTSLIALGRNYSLHMPLAFATGSTEQVNVTQKSGFFVIKAESGETICSIKTSN